MALTKEEFKDLQEAGKIASHVLEYGRKLIKKETFLLEVTEKVEDKIKQMGGELAFPVNISCDSIAAHYAASPNDKTEFNEQLVKLDVGVNVNGWLGDNAVSVDLSGNYSELVKASRDALEKVTKILRPGLTLNEIGATIELAITEKGFQPIRNLSGHEIGQYQVHSGLTIPNYASGEMKELQEGMTIAIEPFATTGVGLTMEQKPAEIFSISTYKPIRIGFVRDMVTHLQKNLRYLPFSRRVLMPKFTEAQINYAFSHLKSLGMLHEYPLLVEKKGGIVSQAENTFYLTKDKTILLTSRD